MGIAFSAQAQKPKAEVKQMTYLNPVGLLGTGTVPLSTTNPCALMHSRSYNLVGKLSAENQYVGVFDFEKGLIVETNFEGFR